MRFENEERRWDLEGNHATVLANRWIGAKAVPAAAVVTFVAQLIEAVNCFGMLLFD